MCETCGCGDTHLVPVEIQESVLAHNDHLAAHNRQHFREAGVLAVNLMGSPGSGKTAVLEATAAAMPGRGGIAALSGDLATDRDARRLQAAGITARTITTGSACHLDAELVHDALHDFPCKDAHTLFIENVGNLVCPAVYDLGQTVNVVALAVTEGEDKPLKYPVMFRKADLVLITKVDLLPHLQGVRVADIEAALRQTMPAAAWIAVSAVTGEGMEAWLQWLERTRQALPATGSSPTRGPAHGHDHDHHHTHHDRHHTHGDDDATREDRHVN